MEATVTEIYGRLESERKTAHAYEKKLQPSQERRFITGIPEFPLQTDVTQAVPARKVVHRSRKYGYYQVPGRAKKK
jgi:hypothetical protein